ncbi:MAG: hypothetical protein ACRD5H_13025, partial [Nitrososphaerales archaeon]
MTFPFASTISTDFLPALFYSPSPHFGSRIGSYLFTSDDLKKKSGYSMMMREEQRQLQEGENLVEGQEVKKVDKDAKMKFILESEADKLDKYQQKKNNGIPIDAYLQWSVGEPISPDTDVSNAFWNPIVQILRFIGILQTAEATHVQKWAHKTNAYSPYDPIDVIWSDPVGTGSSVITTDMHNRMINKSWSTTTWCAFSNTLYVLINGVYTAQFQHKYKTFAGLCDQYHVRIWKINNNLAIGAAHKEKVDARDYDIRHIGGLNTWENNEPTFHVVLGFELGESEVRSAFAGTSGERIPTCWTATANAHSMSNSYTREYWDTSRTTLLYSASS